MVVLFKFFCILLPSLLKTNVCFYHIYLFKLREAKVEETEIIDNIESWRRLQDDVLVGVTEILPPFGRLNDKYEDVQAGTASQVLYAQRV